MTVSLPTHVPNSYTKAKNTEAYWATCFTTHTTPRKSILSRGWFNGQEKRLNFNFGKQTYHVSIEWSHTERAYLSFDLTNGPLQRERLQWKKTSQNSVQQRADINLIHRLAHKHVIEYTHRQTQDRKEEGKESVWFFFSVGSKLFFSMFHFFTNLAELVTVALAATCYHALWGFLCFGRCFCFVLVNWCSQLAFNWFAHIATMYVC